ncbi:MAG: hypothetical protein JSS82_10110 [Bacteroidetes bacterium]|nr:hypothetical protein [Bacteroidota bacterium]
MSKEFEMKSLKAFEENLSSTTLFTARLHAISTYLKPKEEYKYPSTIPTEIMKFISFDDNHFDKIFETGFIALFANFEHFMYEFLKELYTKYPKAIPTERTIKAEDILEFRNYKSIREYLIDSIAIENSYDIDTWNNTIQKLFNLKPIPDDVKVRLMILNSLRNLFLHSGGHWNSKAFKDSRKIEKAFNAENIKSKANSGVSKKQSFHNAKSALTPQIAYDTAIYCFQEIIKTLNSQSDTKNRRKGKK